MKIRGKPKDYWVSQNLIKRIIFQTPPSDNKAKEWRWLIEMYEVYNLSLTGIVG